MRYRIRLSRIGRADLFLFEREEEPLRLSTIPPVCWMDKFKDAAQAAQAAAFLHDFGWHMWAIHIEESP